MAFTPLRIAPTAPHSTHLDEAPVPVILDSGDRARVVTVTFSRAPELGDRFDFEGVTWEIVRARDFLRGFVARAVQPKNCVH